MNAIDQLIEKRKVPDALTARGNEKIKTAKEFEKHREKLKHMLQEHIYGYIPQKPDHLKVELVKEDPTFCAAKAPHKILKLTVSLNGAEASFNVNSVIPKSNKKLPAFIYINFGSDVPDKYMPAEEIADEGFAVFSFCYENVTKDDKNFKDGFAKILSPARRTLTSPGKIAMWAWAAMRVMDYLEGLDNIDLDNVAVIGHSTLGKTALLAGAFDNRFKYSISNNSGCSGAAITRGKAGEHIDFITKYKGEWFCKKYAKYAADESKLPLDQNFLTSLIAPNHLLIGSAAEDSWSDPVAEFLGAYMASSVYDLYGISGLIHNGEIPTPTTVLDEGNICYHLRNGEHYLSRDDWRVYMNFIKKKLAK